MFPINKKKGVSLLRYSLIYPIIRSSNVDFSDRYLHWGSSEDIAEYSKRISIEDGFIRSNGLGVNYATPLSLVFDRRGIYFDARVESDLECYLNNEVLSNDIIERAKLLKSKILNNGITKYNLSSNSVTIPRGHKKVILVPGQVENDMSIKFGSPIIRKNSDLLIKVRENNPEAFIVYKPHPDVCAKQREGGDEELISKLCDLIVSESNILSLFPYIDELHTMTSLSGFEALIRGIKVYTYGLPFYAGWGLTIDYVSCPRRKTKRTIDELVACALILYPVYYHPEKKDKCDVEDAIDWILNNKNKYETKKFLKKILILVRKTRDIARAKISQLN
ncbi:hypothetical protein P0F39_002760 [Vibrio metschnikovii]|nr:hypothetical protein [Vibrio metschnikovii]EKO3781203.1 hypothetical protein [Vibrio metschnikovii]EKO3888042.1 hypothetical protein [Vibrio metschnikovii]EKO3937209.1 hypothetical protein [Vibrio metschnikovii]